MKEDEERRDFYSLYASTQTLVLRLFFYEMQLHKRTTKHDKLFHGFMLKDTVSRLATYMYTFSVHNTSCLV